MSSRTFVLALVALCLSTGCSSISSSSMPTSAASSAYTGQVFLTVTMVPSGAEEVGLIQASGVHEPLAEIAVAFKQEAANLGGNVAKVDRVATTFEMVTSTSMQTYSCGTTNSPQTCSRMVTSTNEVATTTLTGRAFRTRGIGP